MIPTEEWLEQAKRVPVGRTSRVRHGAEARPNMVLYNNADSWSCWCHSCGDFGRVQKTHVVLAPVDETPTHAVMPVPSDAVPVPFDAGQDGWLGAAWRYLLERGIDPSCMLEGVPVLYSPGVRRLLLGTTGGQYVGRGIAGQPVKAITYGKGSRPVSYATHPEDRIREGCHVVICEDYLSALKVRWACPDVVALSNQGTRLASGTLAALLRAGRATVLLDGDDAGYKAAPKIAHRLTPFVQEVKVVFPPGGLDPKNMTGPALRQLIRGG